MSRPGRVVSRDRASCAAVTVRPLERLRRFKAGDGVLLDLDPGVNDIHHQDAKDTKVGGDLARGNAALWDGG